MFLWKDLLNKENKNETKKKQLTKQAKKLYDLQKFKRIRSFRRRIWNGIITLDDALEEQINLTT